MSEANLFAMAALVIIDYGIGNLQSLKKAFNFLGEEPVVTEDAKVAEAADAIVLPGVGAFAAGMRGLHVRGLADTVKAFAKSGKPMLGICLGAQIMFEAGYEFGAHKGLGIIQGKVIRFPESKVKEKIPEVGWNQVKKPKGVTWDGTLFDALENDLTAYFVHSYVFEPAKAENIFGGTAYGGYAFCSAIRAGNVYGTQFHPEKSGPTGLAILKNFLNVIASSHGKQKEKNGA